MERFVPSDTSKISGKEISEYLAYLILLKDKRESRIKGYMWVDGIKQQECIKR